MAAVKHISERDLSALRISEFWSFVQRSSAEACWPWLGTRTEKGYGRFPFENGEFRSHRVAFAIDKNTALPGVVMVCHRCDNPRCCNPGHLFLGVAMDNIRDASDKGRIRAPRGRLNGNGKLSDDQVKEIIESPLSGAALARGMNVSQALVSMIRSGMRRAA